MPIIYQLPIQQPAMVGVFPNQKFAVFGDNLATITTAGYLNQVNLESNPISTTDVLQVLYSFNPVTQVGTYSSFTVTISSSGVITLVAAVNAGDVILPVVSNRIAQFSGTTGTIYDGTAPAVHLGTIEAGASGTQGSFISYPATAANGYMSVSASNSPGNFITNITNNSIGQDTTFSIPDPAGPQAHFVLAPAALVVGNLVAASGTAGLIVDAGFASADIMRNNISNTFTGAGRLIAAKVNGTEAANAVTASGMAGVITTSALTTAGGATYVITWTNTFITATSTIMFSISGGTNTTQNITFTCVPGAGTATLTIFNNTAAVALNGTILISYLVM